MTSPSIQSRLRERRDLIPPQSTYDDDDSALDVWIMATLEVITIAADRIEADAEALRRAKDERDASVEAMGRIVHAVEAERDEARRERDDFRRHVNETVIPGLQTQLNDMERERDTLRGLLDRSLELLRWSTVDEGRPGIPIAPVVRRTAEAFLRECARVASALSPTPALPATAPASNHDQ